MISTAAACNAFPNYLWSDLDSPTDASNRDFVFWGGARHAVLDCGPGDTTACVPGEVSLEQDASAGYGPEALFLRGDLPPGTYEVYVNARDATTNFNVHCNLTYVTVYAELSGGMVQVLARAERNQTQTARNPKTDTKCAACAGKLWLCL
eukprot:2934609-Rhodomonas_salina.1